MFDMEDWCWLFALLYNSVCVFHGCPLFHCSSSSGVSLTLGYSIHSLHLSWIPHCWGIDLHSLYSDLNSIHRRQEEMQVRGRCCCCCCCCCCSCCCCCCCCCSCFCCCCCCCCCCSCCCSCWRWRILDWNAACVFSSRFHTYLYHHFGFRCTVQSVKSILYDTFQALVTSALQLLRDKSIRSHGIRQRNIEIIWNISYPMARANVPPWSKTFENHLSTCSLVVYYLLLWQYCHFVVESAHFGSSNLYLLKESCPGSPEA